MIKSFKCKRTEELWLNGRSNRFNAISRPAMRKLFMLARAIELNDLRIPPGNRLEPLTGKRIGQHSIRINQQYRICFHWNEGAEDVEITDYH
jgi:toxin HigB-1